jgi:protein-disulfide isomerase-like protein with CxxC motif
MGASYLLEMIEYTDPYCTWCWGSEPILRKIEEVHGDQIKISFKMGGLVADMSNFYDPSNRIGGPKWYEQVAAHWLDASTRHGMPVDEQIFFDLKDEMFSTYPANIAYKSAQFQDDVLANMFLRRMREGAAAERRAIQRLDVQVELAKEVGLNHDQFVTDIEGGRAKEAFEEDLKECRRRGIRGFPTFLIRNLSDKKEILLRGYRQFGEFAKAFHNLVGDAISPAFPTVSKDSISAFVQKYKRVATREITEVFDLSEEDIDEYLSSLVSEGLVRKKKVGNGFFYTA